MDEPIRLYEFDYQKPELEDAIIHFGIKGMHWGVRKDRKSKSYKSSGKGRRKIGSKARKVNKIGKSKQSQNQRDTRKVTKEEIHELNKHKDQYSTNEINEILNRYNTEERLSKLDKELNPTRKQKVSKAINTIKQHPYIVAIPVIALLGVAYASKTYKQGVMPDFPSTKSQYAKNFMEDYVDYYKRGLQKSNSAIKFIRKL